MLSRVGRYCIKKYDPILVHRMKSIYRHIYSTGIVNGKRVIYEFDHNPIPEEIVITDKKLGLTSSHDRMSWKVFLDSDYMLDKTIAW